MLGLTHCCISASIFGMLGLTFSLLSSLSMISEAGREGALGSIFLAITFPLLVFAAHCLDRIDEAKREARIASFRRNLLKHSD
jgi:hypothetical protein